MLDWVVDAWLVWVIEVFNLDLLLVYRFIAYDGFGCGIVVL